MRRAIVLAVFGRNSRRLDDVTTLHRSGQHENILFSVVGFVCGPAWSDPSDAEVAAPSGTVVAWGSNTRDQRSIPIGLSGVQEISAGGNHSMALKQDGTVVAWVNNERGQSNDPAGLIKVQAISVGGYHNLAITDLPAIVRVTPQNRTTGVAPGVAVKGHFPEAMRGRTINPDTFTLVKKGSATPIAAAVSYDPTTIKATLESRGNLQHGVTYKAVVATGTKDLAGNNLDQNPNLDGNQPRQWFFTTRN